MIVKKKYRTLADWNWNDFIKGKWKISVLIDNALPDRLGGKESYVGYVEKIMDGFMFLTTPDNNKIERIVVRIDQIISIWVYRNGAY